MDTPRPAPKGLSLKAKLLGAFMAMFAAAAAIGGGAGLFQLRIASLFTQVHERDFPLAVGALKVADDSGGLVESARSLAAAANDGARAAAVEQFQRRSAALKASLQGLAGLQGAGNGDGAMGTLLADTSAAVGTLDGEVRRRLDAAARRSKRMEELGAAHTAFLGRYQPMVRNLTLGIQGLTMDLPSDASGLTMLILTLVSKDLPVRQALSDIISDVNLAVTLLGKADAATTAAQVAEQEKQFAAAAKRVEFSADFLSNILSDETPRKTSQAIVAFGKPGDGVFALRNAEIEARAAGTQAQQALFALVDRLGQQAGALAEANERSANEAADQVNGAISSGLTVTATLVGLAMALGLVSGLFLVNRNIRLLDRLRGTMESLASGDIDLTIPGQTRGDEIGAMARSLEVFRSNAHEVRRLTAEQADAARRAGEARRAAQQDLANQLESSVNSVIGSVLGAAARMRDNAQTLSANADQTKRQTVSVAGASATASERVSSVASAG